MKHHSYRDVRIASEKYSDIVNVRNEFGVEVLPLPLRYDAEGKAIVPRSMNSTKFYATVSVGVNKGKFVGHKGFSTEMVTMTVTPLIRSIQRLSESLRSE